MVTTDPHDTPEPDRSTGSPYAPLYAVAGLTDAVASSLRRSIKQSQERAAQRVTLLKGAPTQLEQARSRLQSYLGEASAAYADLQVRGKRAVDDTLETARKLSRRTEGSLADRRAAERAAEEKVTLAQTEARMAAAQRAGAQRAAETAAEDDLASEPVAGIADVEVQPDEVHEVEVHQVDVQDLEVPGMNVPDIEVQDIEVQPEEMQDIAVQPAESEDVGVQPVDVEVTQVPERDEHH